jgi:hypothetical protein
VEFAREKSHRHVCIVPAWRNCCDSRRTGSVGESEPAGYLLLGPSCNWDWGELDPADIAENEYSVIHGFRLLSSYQTNAGEKLGIITEADRSATTLLLPEEY